MPLLHDALKNFQKWAVVVVQLNKELFYVNEWEREIFELFDVMILQLFIKF